MNQAPTRYYFPQTLIFSAFLFACFFVAPSLTRAATFTVATTTTYADINIGDGLCVDTSGECGLRAAIQEANATTTVSTIQFTISGSGVQTITPTSTLPTITAANITIDGSTQSGSSCGDLWAGTAPTWNIKLDGITANFDGLAITGGGATIKGLDIEGFVNGISLATLGGNTIQCNYLKGNANGPTGGPTARNGIYITSNSNVVGGATAGQGNVISGNGQQGIEVYAAIGTVIRGNFIGINATGTAAVPNGQTGIAANGATSTIIGGTTSGAGNLISGNTGAGINIDGASPSTVLQGNYIGLNRLGTAAIANGGGVSANGLDMTIGGTTSGARNIISGNTDANISIGGSVTVQGNYIGTDVTGTVALSAASAGVIIQYSNVLIGGTTSSARNVISGNGLAIMALDSFGTPVSNNVIEGNYIGVGPDGTTAVGNSYGILLIGSGVSNTQIGGTDSGAGNTITNSTIEGISTKDYVFGGAFGNTGTGNAFLGNSIFNNGIGIDLATSTGAAGPTPNDLLDTDTGPNNLQNFPLISSATVSGGALTVAGSINSTASSLIRIEFFSSTSTDPSGYGEGQTYLGSTDVTTDSSGNATFSVGSLPDTTIGYVVTATATYASSTSEFSASVVVTAPATPPDTTSSTPPPSVSNGSPVISSGSAPFVLGGIHVILPQQFTPPASSSLPTTPPLTIPELHAQLVQLQAQLTQLLQSHPQTTPPPQLFLFTRNLGYGDKGEDVYRLQLFLIDAHTGVQALYLKAHGATHFYGLLTLRAVGEFQRAQGITPSSGYFGAQTRAVVGGIER